MYISGVAGVPRFHYKYYIFYDWSKKATNSNTANTTLQWTGSIIVIFKVSRGEIIGLNGSVETYSYTDISSVVLSSQL
jgi:hypothetical protein